MRFLLCLVGALLLVGSVHAEELIDYGNWCGVRNTQDDENYRCIDGVDCACRQHDLCIERHLKDGYTLELHKCSCDKDFLKALPGASCSKPKCPVYKEAAIELFRRKPCIEYKRPCIMGHCTEIPVPGVGGTAATGPSTESVVDDAKDAVDAARDAVKDVADVANDAAKRGRDAIRNVAPRVPKKPW
ncbi:unnamed protein product [Vitrella brassicaformis CCMP3155]|uniref:Phospholipase A2 domain-containing protein n=2 Tax=Vitrella brassicaformis TaxID=1169539 RepID=A0A0G4EH55_VITBC|nr:unnamed protein product [Vitrella brassicaformis CCMP3155]|eukprot:CEL95569.1 unnamed protein product [Vitrella brassicaformis CCMP3155]